MRVNGRGEEILVRVAYSNSEVCSVRGCSVHAWPWRECRGLRGHGGERRDDEHRVLEAEGLAIGRDTRQAGGGGEAQFEGVRVRWTPDSRSSVCA